MYTDYWDNELNWDALLYIVKGGTACLSSDFIMIWYDYYSTVIYITLAICMNLI